MIAGLLAASIGYLLEARYYKWYVWLFPLGTLWLLDRVSGCAPNRRSWWIAATGLWMGLGWLFRWDVATTGAVACLVYFMLTQARKPSESRLPWRNWAVFLVCFAIPPLAWFGYLLLSRGPTGVTSYVWSTLAATRELARSMGQPLPRFNRSELLSPASTLILAYVMVPTTYLICGVVGLVAEVKGNSTGRSRFLLAVGSDRRSCFHQALHRKDGHHLIQVIAPGIIGDASSFLSLTSLSRGLP